MGMDELMVKTSGMSQLLLYAYKCVHVRIAWLSFVLVYVLKDGWFVPGF